MQPACTCSTAVCIVLQILTVTQQAVYMVHAYPYIADDVRVLEVLAAQRNEVPMSSLTHAGGLSDFQHETNWLQVPFYLQLVTLDRLHQHVPLVSSLSLALSTGCKASPSIDDTGVALRAFSMAGTALHSFYHTMRKVLILQLSTEHDAMVAAMRCRYVCRLSAHNVQSNGLAWPLLIYVF